MNKAKRLRLEAKGWKVGTVEEFLELTPEESAYIELKLKLADGLVQRRQEKELTQIQLAKKEISEITGIRDILNLPES